MMTKTTTTTMMMIIHPGATEFVVHPMYTTCTNLNNNNNIPIGAAAAAMVLIALDQFLRGLFSILYYI